MLTQTEIKIYLCLTDWTGVLTTLHISHLIQFRESGISINAANNINDTEEVTLDAKNPLHDISREIENYCNSPFKPVTGSEG